MHGQYRVGAIGEHGIPPVRGRAQTQQDFPRSVPVEFQDENTWALRGIAVGVTHPVGANGSKVDVGRTV